MALLTPGEFYHLIERVNEDPEYLNALTPIQKAELKAICQDKIKTGGDIAPVFGAGEAPEIWPDNLPKYNRVLELLTGARPAETKAPTNEQIQLPNIKAIDIDQKAIPAICNCLKEKTEPSRHEELIAVLEGKEITQPIPVRVMAKQLIGLFVTLKRKNLIGASTNKNISQWLTKNFMYWDVDSSSFKPVSTTTAQKSFSPKSIGYQPLTNDEICTEIFDIT